MLTGHVYTCRVCIVTQPIVVIQPIVTPPIVSTTYTLVSTIHSEYTVVEVISWLAHVMCYVIPGCKGGGHRYIIDYSITSLITALHHVY